MFDSITAKTIETSQPKTILDAFLKNTNSAPVNLLAGFHGEAETISRQEIYGRGCALAWKFKTLGIETGDKVMTILPTGKPFLVSVFGAWLSGTAIVPVAPPATGIAPEYYQRKLASMIRTAQPKIIIACDTVLTRSTIYRNLSATFAFCATRKFCSISSVNLIRLTFLIRTTSRTFNLLPAARVFRKARRLLTRSSKQMCAE